MGYPFYIVDVFAEEKYAGNQLGVFRSAQGLSDADMQRLAKEVNYSETTFILSEMESRRIRQPEAGTDALLLIWLNTAILMKIVSIFV